MSGRRFVNGARVQEAGPIDASAPTLSTCGCSRHVTGVEADAVQEALEDGFTYNRLGHRVSQTQIRWMRAYWAEAREGPTR